MARQVKKALQEKEQQQEQQPAPQVRAFWRSYRCKACGRLQFRAVLPYGARVQIQCWHGSCRRMNVYKVTERGLVTTDEAQMSERNYTPNV